MSVVRTKFISSSSSRQLHHRFGSGGFPTFSCSRGGNSNKSTFSMQNYRSNLLLSASGNGGVGGDLTTRLLRLTSTDTLFSMSRGSMSNLLLGRKHVLLPTNMMTSQNYFVAGAAATSTTTMRIYSSSSSPQPPNTPRNRLISILGTVGAGGVLLLGKGKYILGALKLTKFASLGSMLLTVGAYTAFYGFPYAIGMTSLILIHESGHALVMRQLGIPFSPMVFIPFMGAAVAMRKRPKDAHEEALVAFGGPVLGSVGALGFAGVAHMTDSQLLYALSDFGFMINLFNLIPLGTLDGGRICGAISPYAGVVGLGMGGLMAYEGMIHNPIFYLILLGGGYETFMRFYDPLGHAPPNYYHITSAQRMAITGGYFGLVGALFAIMAWNQQYMLTPKQLQQKKMSSLNNDTSSFRDFD